MVDKTTYPAPNFMSTSFNDLTVELGAREAADAFIIKHHYTHKVHGVTGEYYFHVKSGDKLVGAAIFGLPGQTPIYHKFSEFRTVRMLELRRLVLLDECPKNSESVVLGAMFRILAQAGIERILSFADPNEKRPDHPDGKHTGLIYRATGFHTVPTSAVKAIWFVGERPSWATQDRYPGRNIDQYTNHHKEPWFWNAVPDEPKSKHRLLREEKHKSSPNGRRWVWIVKRKEAFVYKGKLVPSQLIATAQNLRSALKAGTAEWRAEEPKIGYVKDLAPGMPYFAPPRHRAYYEEPTWWATVPEDRRKMREENCARSKDNPAGRRTVWIAKIDSQLVPIDHIWPKRKE